MAPESFCLLPVSEKEGNWPSVKPAETLLWCGAQLKTYPNDNSFMQQKTVSLVCYLHILSSQALDISSFSHNKSSSSESNWGFSSKQQNWQWYFSTQMGYKTVSPRSVPQSLALSTVFGMEISACKPVQYWAGFCKSAKGKGRREKRVNLCVAPVPIHLFS